MENITAKKLKEEFESHYNYSYKTDREFIAAAEAEYSIEENESGEMVFSGGDEDFIVSDWIEFDQGIILSKRLNFSDKQENDTAIKIKKWHGVNHYETLCLYCADNDINIEEISDDDFYSCSVIMQEYGQEDKSIGHYYFWIDNN